MVILKVLQCGHSIDLLETDHIPIDELLLVNILSVLTKIKY